MRKLLEKIGDYEGVCLEETASNISTNSISFSTLEMTSYSLKEDPNDYYFYIMNKTFEPEITTVKQGDGYLHTYKITRDTTAPGKVLISHNAIYDYSIQVITSIKMDARLGAISCDTSNLKSNNGDLRADYNFDYRFEIRGDKAKNSDGIYTFDEIESKVVKVMPGMGYFIRFLGSLWGGIMFILLGVLFLVFDIVMNHLNKKEADIVHLLLDECMTQEEIAERMNYSTRKIQDIWYSASRKLIKIPWVYAYARELAQI
mgnify:CR=1 FL=1